MIDWKWLLLIVPVTSFLAVFMIALCGTASDCDNHMAAYTQGYDSGYLKGYKEGNVNGLNTGRILQADLAPLPWGDL